MSLQSAVVREFGRLWERKTGAPLPLDVVELMLSDDVEMTQVSNFFALTLL